MNPSQYVKAFVGAVVAGGGSAVTALQDGHVTSGEAVAIIVATAVGFGAVFQIPNASPTPADPGTTGTWGATTTLYDQGGALPPGTTTVTATRPVQVQRPDDPGAPDGATEVR